MLGLFSLFSEHTCQIFTYKCGHLTVTKITHALHLAAIAHNFLMNTQTGSFFGMYVSFIYEKTFSFTLLHNF